MTFEELRNERAKHPSFVGEDIKGVALHKGVLGDSSKYTLENLIDADIWIEFEIAKATSKGLRAEVRTLNSIRKDIQNAGKRILRLREKFAKEIVS